MFAKLLKIFATRCNIKTNIRSGILEELHMKDLKILLSKLNLNEKLNSGFGPNARVNSI